MTHSYFNILLVIPFILWPFSEKIDGHQIKEKNSDWVWLFNGKNTDAWRGVHSDAFPEKGWEIISKELVTVGGDISQRGGDIITVKKYSSFDLRFEYKLTEGANSGLKYFVKQYPSGSVLGCEYQMIDDENNKDIKNDVDGKRLTAGLYELFEAKNKKLNPYGEWNTGRIVVDGKHVEHWLNDAKVLEYERGSDAFMEAKAKSKFKDVEDFGTMQSGHILLQDHSDKVYFRKIKIMEL